MSRLFALLTGLMVLVLIGSHTKETAAADSSRIFRAGAATSNITPPLGEHIVGNWKPIPAAHIHDELFARCIALDDGTTKVAIVICDNVGIPVEVFDAAKHLVQKETGISAAHLLMASNHTHSATTARGPCKVIYEETLTDYQKFLIRRIADGIRRAVNQLEPADIGWGTATESSEVFNRRWHVTNPTMLTNPFGGTDKVRMNPPRANAALLRPAGPIDPQISFVSVRSTSGRPIALLANYSLHYVGGVKKGDVSADYFGYFAKYITNKLGAAEQDVPFVGIMSNGTSGDINNIDFQNKTPRRPSYEKMKEVAMKLATRVQEAHAEVEFHPWVPLDAKLSLLNLQVRTPTPAMRTHFEKIAKQVNEHPNKHRREAIYMDRIAKLEDAPASIEVPLQVIRIGDLGITAIPFETFAETGLELKEESPMQQSFTIELANGSYGYLPTPRQHELGGYETWLGTNYVQHDASEEIVFKLLELLNTANSDR